MRRLNTRKGVNSKPADDDDDDDSNMDPVKLQIRPITRSNLFSRSPKHNPRSSLLIVASVAIALALTVCYFLVSARNSRNFGTKRYGIVIDGGSTGSRIHVFGYGVDGGNSAVFDFGKDGLASMRVNPGLSAYAEDPESAGGSLRELVEFGKGRVPKEHWAETEIRLMATAGLRLLDLGVQNRILNSCRKVLRSSGFKFRDEWASVITGSDEGLYAWVVANHALGTLGGDPAQTTGIIELGGASAQVTFVSSESVPPEFSRAIKFGNVTYNLYSHSFLHFGQNVAYDSLKEAIVSGYFDSAGKSLQERMSIDPCTPKGYSYKMQSLELPPRSSVGKNRHLSALQSRGNFSECRSAAKIMLQKGKEKCVYQQCDIGSTFIPKLRGKFLATENFFYTSKFFGLSPNGFLSNLMMAGQQFCGEDWSKIKKRYPTVDEEALLHYCFSSAYAVALLHDSLGIALDDERIGFANQVGSIPLDWALGAFILQSTSDLDVGHSDWLTAIIDDGSPTLLSVIFIFSILMFTVWSLSKWRKPQLKTIYDLEKGRYIVTRVSR
ncbi:probable apyrase 6 isoform X1 [Pyrus x bretschneideri]|uniref:probable apyrase 6 isoform X1 n=1 Tax=Pyrus x bretschneideri TaxID=225117 RepID=UPI00202E7166|nr:probable apyrase 6 isoform X1 [Pyrus x bretschneideri]